MDVSSLYWWPKVELSRGEQKLYERTLKKRKLYCFLVDVRRLLFDEAFQRELIDMYRQTGAGKPPIPPALMAMATLLQAYTQVGDQEAIELTMDSRRWQLVLDWHDADESPFTQGALYDFRMRLMATNMDQRLLERTVELARTFGGFDPKALRLALDSSPVLSRARVEDTFNLLGHATRKVLSALAQLTQQTVGSLTDAAGLSLFGEGSLKAALDIDWTEAEAKQQALGRLIDEIEALEEWIGEHVAVEVEHPPLKPALATLRRLREQDIEPDPNGGYRIKQGVAKDRQIAVEDPEVRHGRKSKKTRFDGFKRHLAIDLDLQLILAAEAGAANELDAERLASLVEASVGARTDISELHIDRGFLAAEHVPELAASGTEIVCKPLTPSAPGGRWSKRAFVIDLERMAVTCPAHQTVSIPALGRTIGFPKSICHSCSVRDSCIKPDAKAGRSLDIHPLEDLHQRLLARQKTSEGRAELRQRVGVEHTLARVAQRAGTRARYNGLRKNTFAVRMVAAIQNLERAQQFRTQNTGTDS